jgi:hypothetical protein
MPPLTRYRFAIAPVLRASAVLRWRPGSSSDVQCADLYPP